MNKDNVQFIQYVLIVVLMLMPTAADAQKTDHHSVTVIVQPISIIQVNVGAVQMNLNGSNLVAGQDQMTISDQSTIILWGTNISLRKISVNSNIAAPKFTLEVAALNATAGIAAAEVTLSTVSKDFLLNIGRTSGSSIVRYTGSALASQGSGTEIHTISFTFLSQ